MKVEREKRKVSIICEDGSLVNGTIHITPGQRISDFINDEKRRFIVVTNAEFYNIKEIHSFRLFNEMRKKKSAVVLNIDSIKLIEEA